MEVHTSKSYCPAVTQCSCTGIKYFPVTKFPGRICCLRMWSQMWRRKRHGGLHFLSDKSFSALIAICISFHFFPLKQIRQYYQLLFICLLPLKSGGSWLPTSPPSSLFLADAHLFCQLMSCNQSVGLNKWSLFLSCFWAKILGYLAHIWSFPT